MSVERSGDYRPELLELVSGYFNIKDLSRFCFINNIDYDDLRGEGKGAKAQEIIEYLENREELSKLLDWIEDERPNLKDQVKRVRDLYLSEQVQKAHNEARRKEVARLGREIRNLESGFNNVPGKTKETIQLIGRRATGSKLKKKSVWSIPFSIAIVALIGISLIILFVWWGNVRNVDLEPPVTNPPISTSTPTPIEFVITCSDGAIHNIPAGEKIELEINNAIFIEPNIAPQRFEDPKRELRKVPGQEKTFSYTPDSNSSGGILTFIFTNAESGLSRTKTLRINIVSDKNLKGLCS